MSTLTLTEGTLFNNRYRIVRCIAQGGMGAVYEAIHIETERRRALKVMLPHLVQSDDMRTRFRQEAKVAAHIESEFIVDVFDAGIDEATQMPFLVMELLRGEELGRRLKRMGRFMPNEVVSYLHQTALALDKTHRANIVHRDLKPDNLFLTEREEGPPRIKVLDFGVAKFVSDSATNAAGTRSVGTPLYMAPEQFRPGHHVSGATDIYALGMMAYTLLVGVSYWQEESEGNGNIFAFAAMAVHGPQEAATARASRRGVTLPASFDGWFMRAAAMNPAERYATATQAILELADALSVPRPGMGSSGVHATGQTGLSQSGAVAQSGPQSGVQTGTGVGVSRSESLPGIQTGTGAGVSRSGSLPGVQTGAGASQSGPMPSVQAETGAGTSSLSPVSQTQSRPYASQRGAGVAVAVGIVVTLLGLGAAAFLVIPRLLGSAVASAPAAAEQVNEEALPKPAHEAALPKPEPVPAEVKTAAPVEEKKAEEPAKEAPAEAKTDAPAKTLVKAPAKAAAAEAPVQARSAPDATVSTVEASKAPAVKAAAPRKNLYIRD